MKTEQTIESYLDNTELQEKMNDLFNKTKEIKEYKKSLELIEQFNKLIETINNTFLTEEEEHEYWTNHPENEQKIMQIIEKLETKLNGDELQELMIVLSDLVEKIQYRIV